MFHLAVFPTDSRTTGCKPYILITNVLFSCVPNWFKNHWLKSLHLGHKWFILAVGSGWNSRLPTGHSISLFSYLNNQCKAQSLSWVSGWPLKGPLVCVFCWNIGLWWEAGMMRECALGAPPTRSVGPSSGRRPEPWNPLLRREGPVYGNSASLAFSTPSHQFSVFCNHTGYRPWTLS